MGHIKFPYEIDLEVAFRDIDAMGHVNNAVFFSYFETARMKYVMDVLEPGDPEEFEPLDMPLILVRATCSYKSPALLAEKIKVGVGLSRFGTKSFDLLYQITGEDGRLIATGKTVQVMYDYGTRSAYAIPDNIKEQVEKFQKGWHAPDFS